jgi:hypothetical protein
MAKGQFRPPLPGVVGGSQGEDVDRLREALSRLGSEFERMFPEANALIRLGEKVNAGLLLNEVRIRSSSRSPRSCPTTVSGARCSKTEGVPCERSAKRKRS